jgi:hypothetical protein
MKHSNLEAKHDDFLRWWFHVIMGTGTPWEYNTSPEALLRTSLVKGALPPTKIQAQHKNNAMEAQV